MKIEELENLNEEFTKDFRKMTEEYIKLFKKYFKKNTKLCLVCSVHLPINIIMNLIKSCSDKQCSTVFPDLPDMMRRFFMPFFLLQGEWGKISDKKFAEEYDRLYHFQFGEFSIDEESKKNFEKWYESKKT
jgi:hypothetical protein